VNGDLIAMAKNGAFDVIAHGCNCMCVMSAGIAKLIKEEFPEACEADCKTVKGDRSKLGTCTYVKIDENLVIVNAYTQYERRGITPLVDYDALRSTMKWIKSNFKGKRIGLPKIGAGLAGGDWNIIEKIIDEELQGEDYTVIVYQM